MNLHILAAAIGFVLDLIFGDPPMIYHPVRAMGGLISRMEGLLYKDTAGDRHKLWAGAVLWCIVAAVTGGIGWGLLYLAYFIHPAAGFAAECFLCWQLLAAKSLKSESMKVYTALKQNQTEEARRAVSMIVGRDTESLTEDGIIKAAVETVAENTSDGEIAPLCYLFLGGPVLGLIYKAVNTMDSMLGYKNQRYLYFGRAAAKMDDLWNLIPARISAGLMILSTWICGYNWKGALGIYRRDRYQHKSPNSAHTEAVCAGALDIRLAGGAYYFGSYVEKPTIGDPIRPVETEDIKRANRLLYGASWLGLILFAAAKWTWNIYF